MKYNVTAKFMTAFLVALSPFFLVAVLSHYNFTNLSKNTDKLAEHIDELSIINHIAIALSQLEQHVYDYISTGDKNVIKKYNNSLKKVRRELGRLHSLDFLTEFDHDYFSEIDKSIHYFDLFNREIFIAESPSISANIKKITDEYGARVNNIMGVMDRIQDASRGKLYQMKKHSRNSQKYAYYFVMFSWIVSIVFSILVVFFMSYSFTQTITTIDSAAKNIGSGHLDLRVEYKSKDELGELVSTFNDMAEKLQNTTVSKDYFDNIIQTMNDVLIVLSLEGNIRNVNETATRLLGYGKSQMIGKNVSEVFPGDHPLRDGMMRERIRNGTAIQREAVCINKRGEKIPMVFSVSRLHDNPENISGFVCVAQDISFQKKAEQDIKHLSREMIRIQEEERGRMSRELHDNLGGSLLALKISIHSLFSKNGRVEKSKKEEYDKLMDFLNDIIEFSRNLSRSLSPVGLKSVGLERAISELVNTLNKKKKIDISIDLADMNGFFPGNWNIDIYRIIQEALTNIIKHSEADKVEIMGKLLKNKLTIGVKDNGKGIDFDKLSKTDSDDLGLGLLIMRERASLLGGVFHVDSHPEKGTVIKIEITKNKNRRQVQDYSG